VEGRLIFVSYGCQEWCECPEHAHAYVWCTCWTQLVMPQHMNRMCSAKTPADVRKLPPRLSLQCLTSSEVPHDCTHTPTLGMYLRVLQTFVRPGSFAPRRVASFSCAQLMHRTIYFKPAMVTAAIVTCGGLCPGTNDVVQGWLIRWLVQSQHLSLSCHCCHIVFIQVSTALTLCHSTALLSHCVIALHCSHTVS